MTESELLLLSPTAVSSFVTTQLSYEDLFFWGNISARADGERRGSDRTGGQRRKGLGETRLQVPPDRRGSPACAVGMLRDVGKNRYPLVWGMAVEHGAASQRAHLKVDVDLQRTCDACLKFVGAATELYGGL